MANGISPELFDHLVKLAALELDAEEAKYLLSELNKQLKSIDELEAIPIKEDEPITSHGVPYSDVIRAPIREDEWVSCPNPEEILAQAPDTNDDYIVVPDIPHTDLE